MTDRYFPNNYTDFNGENYFTSLNQLLPNLQSTIVHWIQHHTHKVEKHINRTNETDVSVYTGCAGIALLFLRLSIIFQNEKDNYKAKAKNLIDFSLQSLNGKRISFLAGDPGPLAIGAVIYNDLKDEMTTKRLVDKIVSLKDDALNPSKPDEYLYGRAGYLYALMLLRKEISNNIIDNQLVIEIFESMIKSGEKYAEESGSKSPLMYQWHESEYMGAAHGVSGIMYLLLKVANDESLPNLQPYINSHLMPTIEFLTSKRLPSGNYISSSNSKSDRLVQWCHGAPGFVFLFIRTYEVTKNSSYLNLALAAGNVIWERGILRKGYGLCHGTAGNAYTFLYLYRVTNDLKWFHRAMKFAEHCLDYGKHDLSITCDHPYSLFEGLAGTIYFMTDLLTPTNARFPAFD